MRENEIEAKLVAAVKAVGGVCWKFTSPGIAGVPDRIVLMPFGRIGFVEVKTPGEKPRSLQRLRIKTLRRLGFKRLCWTARSDWRIIDEIQTP